MSLVIPSLLGFGLRASTGATPAPSGLPVWDPINPDLSYGDVPDSPNETVHVYRTGAGNAAIARGACRASAGSKVMWELFTARAGNSPLYVGFVGPNTALVANLFDDADAVGYIHDGRIMRNGSVIANAAAIGTSSRVQFALDLGANRFWARVETNAWNGDGSADPASGNGGLDCSSLVAPIYPAAMIYAQNIDVYSRFAGSQISLGIPSGFVPIGGP